jgi:nitroreductase
MDIVKNRYAVRQYQPKAVPEETIRELLEMVRYSVSAINLQPWKIRVVSGQETKDSLFSATFGQNQVRTCSRDG